jgi:predicted AAA+ superfamily ATPase
MEVKRMTTSHTGGGALILFRSTPEEKADYLQTLFQEVYVTDIVDRHRIRNKNELAELLDILSSAIGSFTNPSKLARTFKSLKNEVISDKTLSTYINLFSRLFPVCGSNSTSCRPVDWRDGSVANLCDQLLAD